MSNENIARAFIRDKYIFLPLILSCVCIFASTTALYFAIPPRVEPVALRYTIYFGIDLIGPWTTIFLLPLAGLTIFLINFAIAKTIYLLAAVLSHTLMFATVVVNLLILIQSFLVILLNT